MDDPSKRSADPLGKSAEEANAGRRSAGSAHAGPTLQEELKQVIALLTERERAIMPLLAKGHTNKEIGKAFGISPETVKTHLSAILEKLCARSRAEATAKFVLAGLADDAARGSAEDAGPHD